MTGFWIHSFIVLTLVMLCVVTVVAALTLKYVRAAWKEERRRRALGIHPIAISMTEEILEDVFLEVTR